MNSGWPPLHSRRRRLPVRRGKLHRVRRVEDHRRELAHDGQRAHVHHQIVVAERGAALGEKDALAAGLADFLDRMTHVPRRDELAFLDVHGAAALARRDQQIGLAAEEGGNLQHIDGFGDARHVGGFVHVGQHGNFHRLATLRRMRRPSSSPGPRKLRIEVRLALS